MRSRDVQYGAGRALRAAALALLALCPAERALGDLALDLGGAEGPGWSVGALSLRLDSGGAGGPTLLLRATELSLPPPLRRLAELRLRCGRLALAAGELRCGDGALQAAGAGGRFSTEGFALVLRRAAGGGSELHLRDLAIAGGSLALDASRDDAGWRLHLEGRDLQAQALAPLRATWLAGTGPPLPVTPGAGRLALEGTLAGAARLEQAELQLHGTGLGFSDASGLHAAEDLSLEARVELGDAGDGARRLAGRLELGGGGLYLDPVYLDLGARPLSLELAGRWEADGRLSLPELQARQRGVARLTGEARAATRGGLRAEALELTLRPEALGEFYRVYLQPFLAGSALDRMELQGGLELALRWSRADGVALQARLSGVDADDAGGRFGLHRVGGTLRWRQRGAAPPSALHWGGGHVYRVELGAARLDGSLRPGGFTLAQPLVQPVLDGALRIERLEVAGLDRGAPRWSLQGRLEPLSLQRLSAALDWIPFGGTLSGVIPAVRYAGDTLSMDGRLLVRVFDGTVTIGDLRLERPLGPVPVLHADVDAERLALDKLTGAFSFGKIQGLLSGYVHDLVLEDWQPRSFDAAFATPADDRSRHRISQRAVENLASLGGAGGALSSSFLRFFEEFSYDRLGLSCRLRNGVCEMGGLERGAERYVIVRGAGIPRIEVVGYNREVSWDTLLERLENMTRAEGPVVR